MQVQEYQQHLTALSYGKRLPTAVYVYREKGSGYGPELNQVVAKLVTRHELGVSPTGDSSSLRLKTTQKAGVEQKTRIMEN
jgi:hypothetical protein